MAWENIMCMEALLNEDEMSAHKGFCQPMSANNEVKTLAYYCPDV